MLLPVFFVGVYLTHLTLLRLPYYWDEAGYYIPAAWDFFRTGSLIPSTTLSNAHPPLPSIYLALWWKLGGMVPSVARTAMCLVAAIALLGVYRIALVLTGLVQVAVVTVALTALYPVWFAQSTLAHADLFAAAATLWALSYVFAGNGRDYATAAVLFSIAALCKETAIVIPLSLALYEIWLLWRLLRSPANRPAPRSLLPILSLIAPVLPLAAWYAYHWQKTGFIFGNPEFLRYNATATLTPLRFLLAFGHRALHVTAYMNLFVPVLCMFASMMLPALPETARHSHPATGALRPRVPFSAQGRILTIILANLLLFSVLGGALLTLFASALYTHPAALRQYLAPPRPLLAGAGGAHRRGLSRGIAAQPALPLRPRRQPGLR